MPLGTTLPYGLRDVKLVAYPDLAAVAFGNTLVDLPNAQTFQFNEAEDYDDLRGDDKLVTSHGQGAQVEWELDSGGVNFSAHAVISGAQVVDTGISPNQKRRLRKLATNQRPFFTAIGQAISDSGGDMHSIVYLCRATSNFESSMKDTEFLIPSVSGIGYPCRVSGTLDGDPIQDAIYDWVQHETITSIVAPALDTPAAPTVTALDDITGPIAGGELIKLSGTGFSNATAVNFGATPATDFTIVNNNTIFAVAPAHTSGAVNITVVNPTGTSSTGTANQYTYF